MLPCHMVKTYNVGAHGIPWDLTSEVLRLVPLPLRYTRHALGEAVRDRYGILPAESFPKEFIGLCVGWTLVEAETTNGKLTKFVVRRAVDARRSLVLVILIDGTVKTLWTNLNTDKHATLDKSKFATP